MTSVSMCPLHESDLEFLRELRNDVCEWLGTKSFLTPEMQREWYFGPYAKDSGWLIFIASAEDGTQVGYGQIKGHGDGSVEVGCAVKPDYWGKGYGSAIVEWLLLYVTTGLRKTKVWLWVYAKNERAIRLYEKHDFRATQDLGDGKLRMELQ